MRIAKTVLFPRDTTKECTNIWDDGGRVTFADSRETSDYVMQCIWRIFRNMLLRIFLGTLLGIFELSPVQISSYPSPAYPHANINISASGIPGLQKKLPGPERVFWKGKEIISCRYATGRQRHCMRIAKTVLFPRDTTKSFLQHFISVFMSFSYIQAGFFFLIFFWQFAY
jgi:hypothetical protein